MYEARYWGILSASILHVQAGFIHVSCLGISNKSVAVPRQDSIRPYRVHAVLSGHCNIIILYIHTVTTSTHSCCFRYNTVCFCDTACMCSEGYSTWSTRQPQSYANRFGATLTLFKNWRFSKEKLWHENQVNKPICKCVWP